MKSGLSYEQIQTIRDGVYNIGNFTITING